MKEEGRKGVNGEHRCNSALHAYVCPRLAITLPGTHNRMSGTPNRMFGTLGETIMPYH